MEVAADQVPTGWSNDPNFLRLLLHPKSQEAYLARRCGLTDFKVLLRTTPDTGVMGYILQSGDNYYVSDSMIDHLFLITKPKTLPGILRTLDAEGLQGLRTRKLEEMFLDDEEEEEEEEEEEFRGKKLFTPIGRNAPAN